jgi:hypothetical protein
MNVYPQISQITQIAPFPISGNKITLTPDSLFLYIQTTPKRVLINHSIKRHPFRSISRPQASRKASVPTMFQQRTLAEEPYRSLLQGGEAGYLKFLPYFRWGILQR